MRIVVNGEDAEAAPGESVAAFLDRTGLVPADRPAAVLWNERVLRADERAAARLAEDDRIEILSFLGGGA